MKSHFAVVVVLATGLVTAAGSAQSPARPRVTLPPVIPAVADVRCAIYYNNVTDAIRPEAYGYIVDCKVGRNDGKCWTWTPTEADAGREVPLVLTLWSDAGALSVATTCISVATAPVREKVRGEGEEKTGNFLHSSLITHHSSLTQNLTLALLADSLTNCRYQDRLLERMRESGFTGYRPVGSRTGYSAAPVGTFESGKAAHDGYGGYSWWGFMNNYAFSTDEIDNLQSEAERRQLEKDGVRISAGSEWRKNLLKSPLLKWENGRKVVDVQGWFDRINGGKAPDVILIELGGNDAFYRTEDGTDWMGRDVMAKVRGEMDVMLAALRAAAPTSLIAITTAPTGGHESGFAENYGCNKTSFTFRSNMLLYNELVHRYVAESKDPNLTVVPIHQGIDRETGYPKDNALHLSPAGGEMIGDALYAWLAGRLSPDNRPYEFVDAKRDTDEIAPWIDFETETFWRGEEPGGGVAEAERSTARQLFGRCTLRFTYFGAADVRLRPQRPLAIPADHEWFAAWIRNDQTNYSEPKKPSPDYGLVFVDAEGKETRLPFRRNGYDKKLYWQEWTWMAKRFSPEERKIVDAPGMRFDGFYVSGYTNREPRTIYFDNLAFFTRDESRPLALANVPEAGRPTRPEGAQPMSGDGEKAKARGEGEQRTGSNPQTSQTSQTPQTFVYEGEDGRLEYFWRGDLDTLEASWNGGARFRPCRWAGAKTKPEAARYAAHLSGKTLVVEVTAPAGEEYVSMGRPDGAKILSRSVIGCLADGYEWEDSRSLVTALDDGKSKFFTLTFNDWYFSDASRMTFSADTPAVTNRAACYQAKTDFSFNPVRERIYVTVSPDLMETLPVIANPPSPWKAVTGSHAWCAYASSPERDFDKAFWTRFHGLGVRKVVIGDHECCMRDGGESFTMRDKAAPKKGGDAGLRDWADFLVNRLHYRYGPYNNFTDFAPVNANWRFDRVCRQPATSFYSCGEMKHCSGDLTPAWMRNYGPKPQWAYDACAKYAPILKRKFGVNTAYCDVHTAVYPWIYCDFDARCEGAGKFRTVHNAYCAILDEQKRNWNGPVYSEGGCQYMYAGHVDGNYAQVRLDFDKDPWIADFDLKRIHPLESDFGMGNLDMFAKTPRQVDDPAFPGLFDRFLAATLAFGHAPYLCIDAMFSPRQHHALGYASKTAKYEPEKGLPFLLRSYYMVQPASARYSVATAEEILYLGADGTWRDVSAAVLAGDRKMNRIAVRYSDGTHVIANGDRELRLKACVFGRDLDLPPTGYTVWTADGTLEIESSDRFGSRVDYSASPDAVFLDTRDAKDPVVFPRARGKGRAVRFRDGDSWKTVVLEGQVEFVGGESHERGL